MVLESLSSIKERAQKRVERSKKATAAKRRARARKRRKKRDRIERREPEGVGETVAAATEEAKETATAARRAGEAEGERIKTALRLDRAQEAFAEVRESRIAESAGGLLDDLNDGEVSGMDDGGRRLDALELSGAEVPEAPGMDDEVVSSGQEERNGRDTLGMAEDDGTEPSVLGEGVQPEEQDLGL